MKLESFNEPVAPRASFQRRYLRYVLLALGLFGGSAAFGTVGFHLFGGLSWLDAFVQTVMMLTTMGPIYPMPETSAKLFAAFFALYSSLVFFAMAGILAAPLLHRLLHRFHLQALDDA